MTDSGLDLAAVECRCRGHNLEGRAGRIELLRRAVERGLVGIAVEPAELGGDQVGVVLGDRHHHAHLAGLGLDRHDRALAAAERRDRRLRAGDTQVRDDVEALALAPLEAREDRLELVLLAGQRVVARLLQADAAVADERVTHRVREQTAGRVGAGEDAVLATAARHAAREDRLAVLGEDQPARHLLLADQRPAVARVVLEALRVEHAPVGRERHEHREQQHEQPEELGDLAVHTSPPLRIRSRRALSETIRSSASKTMFASSELPP